MAKNVSNDVLSIVKKKTGKSVSQKDIQKLAGGVKPATLKSDAQLRKLIKQVSSMVNVPVAESTVNEIIRAVKGSNMDPGSMEAMMKMMLGKK